ncbi:MAG: peptidoglycan DD-metalloendopeptidase family protein [Bacteroidales bacterium]|nr:peptidoglycan DD-metalloendopeptidase family protein [Bacteroidales bacterium]
MKLRLLGILLILISALSCLPGRNRGAAVTEQVEEVRDTVYPLGFSTDSFTVVSGTIKSGDNFTAWLTRLGASAQEVHALASASDTVFDVRKLRAGNAYKAYYKDSTALRYVVYQNSQVKETIFSLRDSIPVWTYERPVEIVARKADVTINSSLWNDMIAAGATPDLIVNIADIYAWTVDFFGLQKGDRFRILYSEKMCEGESVGIEKVSYAEFHRGETCLPAVYFDQGDGGNTYWNEKGESMRKAFLKAPLKFTRISSGYSLHRLHPVHGTVRAHTGVDYAAPTGTPVRSIGDGTVLSAGWGKGGAGNMVKIRHNSVYTTAYLHLSKMAVKAGQRVSQGQVIGYVGMTGTATGPHLDFRVWRNGSPINPLKLESPPSEPIREENLPALDSVLVRMRAALEEPKS